MSWSLSQEGLGELGALPAVEAQICSPGWVLAFLSGPSGFLIDPLLWIQLMIHCCTCQILLKALEKRG